LNITLIPHDLKGDRSGHFTHHLIPRWDNNFEGDLNIAGVKDNIVDYEIDAHR
jgi:hypothetical protein